MVSLIQTEGRGMPSLTPPTVPPGSFSDVEQPVAEVGDGIALRPYADDDAPLLLDVYSDPDIQRWHCKTLADVAEAMIAEWRGTWSSETDAHWAIVDCRNDVASRITLRQLDFADGVAGSDTGRPYSAFAGLSPPR
ncbi:GNAT family N-acetyltransferase [Nocardia sp. NRRL WC-3656]|uniref:GNAT family N-acetyltransferase n=1 Tax=Nocardia sp. NRRL WC-3656 TaxID=1463824 RepID=UPI00068967AF|nr:GNAT family N-acetyltransferase [Nocardia sp. NRRL WC-3656]